ncbi:MAG TPA: TetR/AcrR family transcriptional regulator [Armatimonadetes bacterium]|nr:TetR/AcrR family transcriptional regulator [Armatimonadota bacterium]
MARESHKAEILEAALRLFVDKGVKAATTREIAAQAGVSEGAIYRHFASKGELAHVLFTSCAEQLLAWLRQGVKEAVHPPDQLLAAVRAFFAFAHRKPLAYAYLMETHQREFERLPKGREKPKDVFVDIIRRGIAQGYFRPLDANLAAALVIGMAIRTIFFLKQGLIEQPPEQVLTEVGRAALRVLARE